MILYSAPTFYSAVCSLPEKQSKWPLAFRFIHYSFDRVRVYQDQKKLQKCGIRGLLMKINDRSTKFLISYQEVEIVLQL